MKDLIETLAAIAGPSGFEGEVRAAVEKELKGSVDEMRVDKMGNLIARKGKKDGLTVMLAAHMDEIGLIASHIDENGFVRFKSVGAVYPRNLPGGRVRFMNGVPGVVAMEWAQNRATVYAFERMYIDVGASSAADCPVQIGDMAAFERPFTAIGDRLVSKAMDDRAGVAVLVETLKQLKDTPHNVVGVFTVQEEVGTRGATAAAYGIDPDIGIAVDVTLTGDTPKGHKMEVALGKGPAIKLKDLSMVCDPQVVAWMEKGAKRARIPHQFEILTIGWSDARVMQTARAGVPTGALSIPCRYVHTPSEMVDLQDVENAVKLLAELLSKPIKL